MSLRNLLGNRRTLSAPAPFRARLDLESLEERAVPATLDLTTAGAIGELSGGIFHQDSVQPAGSGVIHSFVRLQTKNGDNGVVQGYNTDARPLQFDEKLSPSFTHSLRLGDVPTVDVGGTLYREFLLDINQTNSTPLLSLDELRVYTGSTGNVSSYNSATNALSGCTLNFDLGANWIKLNAGLNPGSGVSDMVALIPDSNFAGASPNSYVYLYSKFGVNLGAHGGFEEWAVHGNGASTTPASGFISGTVFYDTNDNGTLDTGDVGLPTWQVTITDVGTGLTFTTYTDAHGDYLFNNLATGLGSFTTYTISFVLQSPDYVITTPSSYTYALDAPGQSVTNVNFGVWLPPPPPPVDAPVSDGSTFNV
jgi:hypothetical protein